MVSLLQDQGEHVNVDQTSQPQKQDEPDLPDHVAPIIRRLMRGASSTTGKGTCVLWMLLRYVQHIVLYSVGTCVLWMLLRYNT